MVRASLAGGSASVRTNFWIGAFSTPSSIDNACSRVGRLATRSSSAPGRTCPPRDTSIATSFSFALAKSFTTRAAAPGSSFENASTRGPLSFGPTDSNDVPTSALRASVFFTTRMYTPDFLALARSSVICPTDSPRYSAATTDWACAATSATSATSAFLSSRLSAIHLSSQLRRSLTKRTFNHARFPLSTVTSAPRGVPRCEKRFTICAGGPLRGPIPSPAVFDDGWRRDARQPASNFPCACAQHLHLAQSRLIHHHARPHGRGQRDAL